MNSSLYTQDHFTSGKPAALSVWLLCCILFLTLLPVSAFSGPSDSSREYAYPALDSKQRAAIIDSISVTLIDNYIFLDKAEAMEKHIRKQLKKKKYDQITDIAEFSKVLTDDLRSICKDLHLGIRPLSEDEFRDVDEPSRKDKQKQYYASMENENFGFHKVEHFSGNVGYLDLRSFADLSSGAGETAIAAMNFLAHSDAIIIDLRHNGGGSPSMIQLLSSYFFPEPVHLNDFYIRKTNMTNQFWTQSHVDGKRMCKTPLYILTSKKTFSGAEEFTYNMKILKRATIVGETTGGGAHPIEFNYFRDLNFGMSVPYGRAVNPITGTNWEGTGVEPDIAVNEAKAFDMAYSTALKKMRDETNNQKEIFFLDWAILGLESRLYPVKLDEKQLNSYTGNYGPRKTWIKNSSLLYQRDKGTVYELIPMGKDWFRIDDLDWFRVQFVRDKNDKVTEIVGHYSQGQKDMHKKES